MRSLENKVRAILLAFWLMAIGYSGCHAQARTACDFLSRAEVESTLKLPLPRTQSGNGFCTFRGEPVASTLQKQRYFTVSVLYSPAPNPGAVQEWLKNLDEKTYDDPVEVPALGDAAFWKGQPQDASLIIFRGGTMLLSLGPGTLAQLKVLALKALRGNGKTGYAYRTGQTPLPKPALGRPGAKPSQIERLKRELTAKAEAGIGYAQLALGDLYQFGQRGADGNPKPDYAGAAYWYQQAVEHGQARAAYELGILFRRGAGVPENQQAALDLFKKAALAGYVPAMAPLAFLYDQEDTPVHEHREINWAMQAAQKGDPDGLLIRGYLYNKGRIGGSPEYYIPLALADYQAAAAHGNCVAMMDIGGLYFNGTGVTQDKEKAQGWFAKAEACSGPGLAWVKEKSAKFREKAAAGRLPAVAVEASKLSASQKLAAGLMATLVIAMAARVAESGPSEESSGQNATGSGGGTDWNAIVEHDNQMEQNRRTACIISGGKPALGCY